MSEDYKGKELGWEDFIEKGNSFILLPEGDYEFVVESFERGRFVGSDKVPACPKADLKIRIDTPEGTCIMNESLLLYNKLQWKLAEFFLSIGAMEEGDGRIKMDWNIVPRATGRATIEVRPDRNDPTRKYNHVKRFLPKPKKEYKAGSF